MHRVCPSETRVLTQEVEYCFAIVVGAQRKIAAAFPTAEPAAVGWNDGRWKEKNPIYSKK